MNLYSAVYRGNRMNNGTASRHSRYWQGRLNGPAFCGDPEIPLLVERVSIDHSDLHDRIDSVIAGEFCVYDFAYFVGHDSVGRFAFNELDLLHLRHIPARTEHPAEIAKVCLLQSRCGIGGN